MICLDGFYGIFRSSAAHPRNENGVAGVCEKNSLILGLVWLRLSCSVSIRADQPNPGKSAGYSVYRWPVDLCGCDGSSLYESKRLLAQS